MRVLALYNLKGGVGKTATAVNLAWLASQAGFKTLFWDLDPQAAGSWYLRGEEGLRKPVHKLLSGKQPLGREIVSTAYPLLDLIPADASYRHLDLQMSQKSRNSDHLKQLLQPLSETYSLVILDCAPSFSVVSENVFHAADLVAVPLIPTPLSLRTWDQVRQHFRETDLSAKTLRPFLNMVDRRRTLHRQWLTQPPEQLKRQLSSWIPYASDVEKMGEHRAPLGHFAANSPSAVAYQALWQELDGQLQQ